MAFTNVSRAVSSFTSKVRASLRSVLLYKSGEDNTILYKAGDENVILVKEKFYNLASRN